MTRFYFDPPTTRRKAPNTMRRLLVRCQETSKLVPTGETTEEPLWITTKTRKGKFTCPHCGRVHTWVKKDVILAR